MEQYQIGFGVKDFLKKHKIISKALNFLKTSGLQDQLLDKLPVPGNLKNYGKKGIDFLSNYLQEKGYGYDLKSDIDFYILPDIDNKGFGIKEISLSAQRLNQIYAQMYQEIIEMFKELKENQEKLEEKIDNRQVEQIPLEQMEKTEIQGKKFYNKGERKKDESFLDKQSEGENQVIVMEKKANYKKKKPKEKNRETLMKQLEKSYKKEFLENEEVLKAIEQYLNNEIQYNEMQKIISKIKKDIEKQKKVQKEEERKEIKKPKYSEKVDQDGRPVGIDSSPVIITKIRGKKLKIPPQKKEEDNRSGAQMARDIYNLANSLDLGPAAQQLNVLKKRNKKK